LEGIIKVVIEEYREDNLAVRTIIVTFLGIPILRFRKTSTNHIAVEQLTVIKEPVKIKGFK
jgi:hypothetical protein